VPVERWRRRLPRRPRRQRDGLAELAAVDGAAFELFDEIGDESFH
jgi:hypothetical protein